MGNIIGSVLSADIYSRYAKNRNYNTLFICGTDEYGTATETKTLEEKSLHNNYVTNTMLFIKKSMTGFDIGFDYFGRTTTSLQTEIAQDIFLKLHNKGYLEEKLLNNCIVNTINLSLLIDLLKVLVQNVIMKMPEGSM